ncbi:MAG: VWA domain-containing protein [Bacteroidia bacterium]|nr:VWA domain-containing protein [Bacteroidia bacterium]
MALASYGQQLAPNVHNFGKVKLWNNPKAHFTFTNPSNKRVLFLPIPYQRNLYVHLPEGYIEPGETVEIEAIYYTEELGNFTLNQPLYLSGWPDPIYLNMKGKILTFHPDAHIACPNMGQEQKEEARSEVAQIIVVDKETGELLTGVDLLLVGTSHNYFVEKTRKTHVPLKRMPIGLYQVDVSKHGYMGKKELLYINKKTETIIFELERNPMNTDVIEEQHDFDDGSDDEIVEIEKPKESDQDAIERIRRRMDERFKGRKIFEKDVMVVKEPGDTIEDVEEVDTSEQFDFTQVTPEHTPENTPETTPTDTTTEEKLDFAENGQLNPDKYASNNVVFLIDESSSMMLGDKMDMLKTSMKRLVNVLRPEDMVTIVVYSRRAEVRLSATPGDQKDKIISVIDSLAPGGRSYGAEGLSMSYDYARANFITGGNNQIVLATDGLFNSPNYTSRDMYLMANENAGQGVLTTVVGFGKNKEAMQFMKELSANGNGSFIKVKTPEEAEDALLTEIMNNALR